jgi:hypothetical protein
MSISRVAPLVVVLAIASLGPAQAQFGGMPGMPGSPGTPGSPFGAPRQGPPPACQELLSLREETGKHGQALQAAGKKKAPPEQLCKLFKTFIAAESKMLKGLEEHRATCGVPAEVIKQVQAGHNKATQMSKRVCDSAAQGPRPTGPSLSEALGAAPMVPDSSATKRGQTFDTLSGSPLVR